jgi:4-hydroxy-2-oxoglutarate aldolase
MTTRSLSGILPPIPTTFDSTGQVDLRAIADNVRRWNATRLSGILALGSNGEASLLDDDECDAVLGAVRDVLPADKLLLAGVGRESTRATIAAAVRAGRGGATAVLVRPPSAFRAQMTPDALLKHFTAVADASPVPVLLYNLPGPTGITLNLPLVAQLSEHPNVAGMKETSPELERLGQFAALRPEKFAVLCGWAPVVYPALVSGAAGAILAVANVMPDLCVALYEAARAGRHGDDDEALALQRAITPLAQLVTSVHGISGLKIALEIVGYHGGPVRAPLMPATSSARDEIAAAVAKLTVAIGGPERSALRTAR